MTPTMTMQEVAGALRVSLHTAYERARAGLIPCQRKGKRGYLIHRAEFERWLREGTPVAVPQTPPEPQAQSISINAGGVTLCITIEIRPDQPAGRGLRVVANG